MIKLIVLLFVFLFFGHSKKSSDEIKWVLVEGGPTGDFYISGTEVTFTQYDEYCDATGSKKPYDEGWGRGDRPVINLTLADAKRYCEWLSNKTGDDIRLPEEDEWEYAASGGNESNRYIYSGSNDLDEVGWYWVNSGDIKLSGIWSYEIIFENNCKTQKVGTKNSNELGIYDMSGNAWEWVGENGYIRGGSWNNTNENCTIYYRNNNKRNYRHDYIGFRILRDINTDENEDESEAE